MSEIKIRLPEEIGKAIKKHGHIDWEGLASRAIQRKLAELKLMEAMTSKSKLSMKDVLAIDKKVKKGLRERYSP